MSIDRISNMLSSVKNSSMAERDVVEVVYSKECESVAKVLKDKGFFEEVKVFKKEDSSIKMMKIVLAKEDGRIIISHVKRISKPGRRIYRGWKELKPVLQGLGVLIVSTSRGIMSGGEAYKKKLGGEVVGEVY